MLVKCSERSSTRSSKLVINPRSPDDFPWPWQSMPWTPYPALTSLVAQPVLPITQSINQYSRK